MVFLPGVAVGTNLRSLADRNAARAGPIAHCYRDRSSSDSSCEQHIENDIPLWPTLPQLMAMLRDASPLANKGVQALQGL